MFNYEWFYLCLIMCALIYVLLCVHLFMIKEKCSCYMVITPQDEEGIIIF
jgi:hypothetical protein